MGANFKLFQGSFNKDLFNRSYGFIKEIEKEEVKLVKEKARKENNSVIKERLEKLHQSLASKLKTDEIKDKKESIKKEWKKIQTDNVKKGGKAYHLKDSDVKKLQLVEKFKSMKHKEVTNFLEKKRKRNAAAEHKFIPRVRHDKSEMN